MKCVILLLVTVSCATAQYRFYSPYTAPSVYSYGGGYFNPYLLRKKRAAEEGLIRKRRDAPEAPADDQQGADALVYSTLYSGYRPTVYSTYGYPASTYGYGVPFLRKKRAAPEA